MSDQDHIDFANMTEALTSASRLLREAEQAAITNTTQADCLRWIADSWMTYGSLLQEVAQNQED